MKSARAWLFALGAIFVCVLFVAAVFTYAAYASPGGAPPRPLVRITGTFPDGSTVAGRPVVVFGEASDPSGIAGVEIWINGAKAGTQENPDASSPLLFETDQAWIPNASGNFLVILRATNGKGYSADSDPLLIIAAERSLAANPDSKGEYIVRDGDTWESIAAAFETTPAELRALNPGLEELPPGASLSIPPRPGGEAGGEAAGATPTEEDADIPRLDPPGPPPPPTESGGSPAEPVLAPWWGSLPLPGSVLCTLSPAACAVPGDTLPPPPRLAPADVVGEPGSGCGVDVLWTDNSDDETGFLLYRITNRPSFHFDLLETFRASPGSGARLRYLDAHPPNGSFFYSVASYNAGGNTWSAPSPMYTSEGCPAEAGTRALVVEALYMNLVGGYDRAYCYASLADSPFERVPAGASNFITHPGGAWNIAEYFTGENRRTVMVDAAGPLNITVECLAWRGDELVNLGRFTRSHPPVEWDGRELRGEPDGGAYMVSYRIDYSFHAADESGHAAWPIVDPAYPAPFNLHQVSSWTECTRSADDLLVCGDTAGPALAWDYAPPAGRPRPLRYQVYRRFEGGTVPVLYHTATSPSRSAPLAAADCAVPTYYSVSAVVMLDPETAEDVQSPMSEELLVPASCGSLEITLTELYVYGAGDPGHDYEAYGTLWFNGTPVIWNSHCDGGDCLTSGPSYTSVHEATVYSWADMFLSIDRGRFSRSNNVLRVPIHDGETLRWSLVLWDHNDIGDDHTWCGGRRVHTLDARPIAEWLSFNQDVTWNDPYAEIGQCAMYFHVRGLPAGAP